MEMSSDPYEQKLYHMFSSHDVNSTGFLSEPSLVKLCKTLELKDNQQICLLKCLLKEDKQNVSFEEFKDGLLSFLGNEMAQSTGEFFFIYFNPLILFYLKKIAMKSLCSYL